MDILQECWRVGSLPLAGIFTDSDSVESSVFKDTGHCGVQCVSTQAGRKTHNPRFLLTTLRTSQQVGGGRGCWAAFLGHVHRSKVKGSMPWSPPFQLPHLGGSSLPSTRRRGHDEAEPAYLGGPSPGRVAVSRWRGRGAMDPSLPTPAPPIWESSLPSTRRRGHDEAEPAYLGGGSHLGEGGTMWPSLPPRVEPMPG